MFLGFLFIYIQLFSAPPKIPENTITTAQPTLKPLTIDVPRSLPTIDITGECDGDVVTSEPLNSENLLLTTAETNSTSLSKDHTVLDKVSTPNVPRLIKKSSSTPRRSSHIRVLDFNTPRRILEENIIENPTTVECINSPNIPQLKLAKPLGSSDTENNPRTSNLIEDLKNDKGVKDNNGKSIKKKSNWDADLRAMISVDDTDSKIQVKHKSVKKKRKPPEKKSKEEKDHTKSKEDKRKTKTKHSKSKSHENENNKSDDSVKVITENINVTIKPTINLITREDKLDKSSDAQNDTPEMDPVSLQHAIGAKLNISDFLETPYKQAMYDIQMDTPRFLGAELLGEPFSDIKIMNIPTPRFLNTPKAVQATPSSYSSRPTDYSSGGSYYKPDDHDYPNILEELGPPITSSPVEKVNKDVSKPVVTDNISNKEQERQKASDKNKKRSSRPVRECTKNVSYVNSPFINKTKNTVDSNYTPSKYSNSDNTESIEHAPDCDTPEMEDRAKSPNKVESKKKRVSKSTPKIKAKLKISPKSVNRSKKKGVYVGSRKRMNSKDKNIATPVVLAAPTKSRRKSSTPRKLHCTKTFSTGNSEVECTEVRKDNLNKKDNNSDVVLPTVRWADEMSENCKSRKQSGGTTNEVEDIAKIKEYIEKTSQSEEIENIPKISVANEDNSSLHMDLVKRGFDFETAKIIERDLLDVSPITNNSKVAEGHVASNVNKQTNFSGQVSVCNEKSKKINETDGLKEKQHNESINSSAGEEFEEELEFSIHDCDEHSNNFIFMKHEEGKIISDNSVSFKNTFCMEICIEDVVIRLNTTPLVSLFHEEPKEDESPKESEHPKKKEANKVDEDSDNKTKNVEEAIQGNEAEIDDKHDSDDSLINRNEEETETAVQSISLNDKLYTPQKQMTDEEAKCYELFDSTLGSLDTPLKANSPKSKEVSLNQETENDRSSRAQELTVSGITLEIESVVERETTLRDSQNVPKKRKRLSSSISEDNGGSKKSKPQYLKNIQNFDIESVLSRLHGP